MSILKWARGLTLVLGLLFVGMPAFAQTTGPAGSVLVRDDPDTLAPGRLPRAATPGREQDRYVMTNEEWNRRYAAIDTDGRAYQSIASSNDNFCSLTGRYIQRADTLSSRFAAHDTRFAALGERVASLKGSRVTGSWLRRLGVVVGIGAAATISGPYAGVVAGPMIGGEFASTMNDRAQDLNREVTLANIDLTRDNIESNLLTLDMDMFWVEMVAPWCAQAHPTAGVATAASYAPANDNSRITKGSREMAAARR